MSAYDPKLKSPVLAEAQLSALAGISALCFDWVGYDLAGIRWRASAWNGVWQRARSRDKHVQGIFGASFVSADRIVQRGVGRCEARLREVERRCRDPRLRPSYPSESA